MFDIIVRELVPKPAAGADFSFVPSNGDRFKLLTLTAKLTTSAAVANRLPAIQIKGNSGNVYWIADAGVVQPASMAVQYSWAKGASNNTPAALIGSERLALTFPEIWLLPGDSISSATNLKDVADQWSAITFRGIVTDEWEDMERYAEIAHALSA